MAIKVGDKTKKAVVGQVRVGETQDYSSDFGVTPNWKHDDDPVSTEWHDSTVTTNWKTP